MLNIIYKGEIVRNAVRFNPKNWQGVPMETDQLLDAVGRLFNILDQRKIDYLLVGGIALLQYIEGRNTEDINLIIAASALNALPEIEITRQDEHFAQGQMESLVLIFC